VPRAERLPGLDLLRTIAAAALLLSHGAPLLLPLGIPLGVHLLLGYYGVEAFVMVCAFLLARELLHEDQSAVRFVSRRAWRWLPWYWLALALNLMWAAPVATSAPPSILSYVLLVQNMVTPHPPFFGEAWFVVLLAWFALLLPMLCRALKRLSRRGAAILLLVALLAAHALRWTFIQIDDLAWHEGIRKTVLARLDLPLFGVAAAWFWPRGSRHARELAGAGLLCVGGTCWMYLTLPLDSGVWLRLLLFTLGDLGLVLLLPWACAATLWPTLRVLVQTIAPTAFVGCLTHLLLLRLAIAAGIDIRPAGAAAALAMFALYVVAVAASSWLIWRALDRPWLALRERWLPSSAPHVAPVAERRGAGT